MNIFRINNKYVAVAIFLMLCCYLTGTGFMVHLQYMFTENALQMKKFESNRFNEHLFFSLPE